MLYFTYNANQHDGFCGQFQRILCILALAQKYGAQYVHTPFQFMEHIPEPKSLYLNKIEDYLQLKNYFPSPNKYQYDEIVNIDQPTDAKIIEYQSISTSREILCIMISATKMLDEEVDDFNRVLPLLRQIRIPPSTCYFNTNTMNIAVHIRRGDVDPRAHPTRYTPLYDFKRIIDRLLLLYPTANLCIFTEITTKNKDEFAIFQESPRIRVVANEDILITFEHLITANILVTSKSSFSYVAALYNTNQVIYTEFWHPPLSHWNKITPMIEDI